MTEPQTSVEIPQTAIAEYKPTVAALAELRQRFGGLLFPVTTAKGLAEAKAARAELRTLRTSLEDKRVEIKRPVLERERTIDAEAKWITAALSALEDPIDEQIKSEEKRRADAKAAAEEADRQRVERLRGKLLQIQGLAVRAIGKTAEEIAEAVAFAEGLQITAEAYEEFADLARIELATALKALRDAHALQVTAEAEAAALKERMRQFDEQQANARRAQAEEDQRRREAEQHQRKENDRIAKEQKDEADRLAKIAADIILQSENLRKLNEAEAERLAKIASDQAEQAAEALDRAWGEAIDEDRLRSMTSVTITPTPEQAEALAESLSNSPPGILVAAPLGTLAVDHQATLESPPANAMPDPATLRPATLSELAQAYATERKQAIDLIAGSASRAELGPIIFRGLHDAWLDGYRFGFDTADGS